jgi:hypothetical protein
MSVAGGPDGLNDVYEALERYNWDDDVEFQSGLNAILGSNSTPDQAAELALRARCFYYARCATCSERFIQGLTVRRKFNINIDFDGYKAYRNARNRPPPTPPTTGTEASFGLPAAPPSNEAPGGIMSAPTDASEPAAPYPTSFAHIVELITTGKPVPGIKEIPSTVLSGQGTEAAKSRRKKPWEKEEAGAV